MSGIKYLENIISDKFIGEKDVKHNTEHLMKNGMFENKLELCEGCQVMWYFKYRSGNGIGQWESRNRGGIFLRRK